MGEKPRLSQAFPPSDYIREEMEARGWTVRDMATRTGLREDTIDGLLAGERAVTTYIAGRLAGTFGTSSKLWLNFEKRWQEASNG